MHWYLLTAVPSSSAHVLHAYGQRQAAERGYEITEVSGRRIMDRCPPNHKLFCLSDGPPDYCSCTIYRPAVTEREIAKHEQKYRRHGWSEAKIARAIGQVKERGQSLNMHKGLEPSTQRWLANLVREIGSIYIIAVTPQVGDQLNEIEPVNEATIDAIELQNGKALILPCELVKIVV